MENRGGTGMEEQFNTMKMNPIVGTGNEAHIITGDPTYITSYNSARSLICRLERDEILEELVSSYLETHSEF